MSENVKLILRSVGPFLETADLRNITRLSKKMALHFARRELIVQWYPFADVVDGIREIVWTLILKPTIRQQLKFSRLDSISIEERISRPCASLITKDIQRTFPRSDNWNTLYAHNLGEILKFAISGLSRNQEYIQGMNFIVAMIYTGLRYNMKVSKYCACTFMHRIRVFDRFDPGFCEIQRGCLELERYIEKHCCALRALLELHSISLGIFTFSWVLLLFAGEGSKYPAIIPSVLLVFDAIILSDCTAAQVVTMDLLSSLEDSIMLTDTSRMEDVIEFIKRYPYKYFMGKQEHLSDLLTEYCAFYHREEIVSHDIAYRFIVTSNSNKKYSGITQESKVRRPYASERFELSGYF